MEHFLDESDLFCSSVWELPWTPDSDMAMTRRGKKKEDDKSRCFCSIGRMSWMKYNWIVFINGWITFHLNEKRSVSPRTSLMEVSDSPGLSFLLTRRALDISSPLLLLRFRFDVCLLLLLLCFDLHSLLLLLLVNDDERMSWDIQLDDQLLQDLYAWIDQVPLSRPKKRIEKDFSDAGRCCEVSPSLSLLIECFSCLWLASFLFVCSDGGRIDQILLS